MNKKSLDLTKGDILKSILAFMLPVLAGSFFQQLYTTVDAIIVGNFAGKIGLASIDAVNAYLRLPINFLNGLSVGATILISQFFGAKKESEVNKSVHTAITFAIIGGVLFSIIGILIAPFSLDMLSVPTEVYQYSLGYVRIYYIGFVFSMIYNISAGILRAVGNSRTPFHILVITGAINVILDLVFVGLLGLNAQGAAMATVIAQATSAILILYALTKGDDIYKVNLRKLRLDKDALKSIVKIGLPVGLQSSFYPIANMIVQSSVNLTGTNNIAAWALCGKIDFLMSLTAESFGSSVSTFVAQNYGAKQYERAKKGVNLGLMASFCAVGTLSIIIFFFAGDIGKLFINSNDYDVIPLMEDAMKLIAPMFVFYGATSIFSGAIRGCGETFIPMLITLSGTCLFRILWIVLAVPFNTSNSLTFIVASYPLSWLVTASVYFIAYRIFKNKRLTGLSA